MSGTTPARHVRNQTYNIPAHIAPVKVIAFNGPPKSGKDTATNYAMDYLATRFPDTFTVEPIVIHLKLSALLKQRVHQFLNIDIEHDAYEVQKDIPLAEFLGATPRQAYINFSEGFAKPTFGKHVWMQLAWKTLEARLLELHQTDHDARKFVVISDLGFQEEIEFLLSKFSPYQVGLVRLQRDGCDFSNDSRDYVFSNTGGEVWEKVLYNNTTLSDFNKRVCGFVSDFALETVPMKLDEEGLGY